MRHPVFRTSHLVGVLGRIARLPFISPHRRMIQPLVLIPRPSRPYQRHVRRLENWVGQMFPMSNRPDVLAVCSLTAIILLVVQNGHAGPHSMQCTYRSKLFVCFYRRHLRRSPFPITKAPCLLRELRRLTVLCCRYVSIVCSARAWWWCLRGATWALGKCYMDRACDYS